MHPDEIVELLGLSPHPEGGFFAETHRAPASPAGGRAAGSAIYFLLTAGAFSAFHVIGAADEIWHHYQGAAVELHTIDASGVHRIQRLGGDLASGARPQVVVPAGTLQAACIPGDGHALCGCTVTPAFEFADFAMPTRAELLARFPAHAAIVRRFTRS